MFVGWLAVKVACLLLSFSVKDTTVRPVMRWLLLMMLGVPLFSADPGGRDGQVLDRALRYVNGQVITLGDLVERLQTKKEKLDIRSMEDERKLWESVLVDATEDLLLLLFAEEKQVSFDRRRLNDAVYADVQRIGRPVSLAEVATMRETMERREKINAALGFFEQKASQVTPAELLDAYAARKTEFQRPPRAQVLQLVMRAGDAEEREAIRAAQASLFRRAQDAGGAAAAVAAPFLERLLALTADDPARDALLDEVMTALTAIDPGADAKLLALTTSAGELVARRKAWKTHEEVDAILVDLRDRLRGQDADAFRAEARARSEGPRREEGGDLGWVEPGFFRDAWDEAVFQVPVGQVSDPIWLEATGCLLLVLKRDDAAQRPFAEVCGEIESGLRRERSREVRKRAARVLAERATVRDLISIEDLLSP